MVELGPGIYGAEAAAEHYFGKTAAALDEREAALLAASLPRPAIWNPASGSRFYLEQVARIEDRMGRATFLWQRIGGAPSAVEPPPTDAEQALVDSLLTDTLLRTVRADTVEENAAPRQSGDTLSLPAPARPGGPLPARRRDSTVR